MTRELKECNTERDIKFGVAPDFPTGTATWNPDKGDDYVKGGGRKVSRHSSCAENVVGYWRKYEFLLKESLQILGCYGWNFESLGIFISWEQKLNNPLV